jgi:nitrogen regulatory protein PII
MPYENAEDNDLDDKVKLLLSVHDQQVSEVRECTVGNHTNRANGKAAMYVIPWEL